MSNSIPNTADSFMSRGDKYCIIGSSDNWVLYGDRYFDIDIFYYSNNIEVSNFLSGPSYDFDELSDHWTRAGYEFSDSEMQMLRKNYFDNL